LTGNDSLAERIAGHRGASVFSKRYDRSARLDTMLDALQRWADAIDGAAARAARTARAKIGLAGASSGAAPIVYALELQRAFRAYEDLGAEILNTPHVDLIPRGVSSMALVENVRGHARVLEDFAAVIEKLVPNVVRSDRRGPLQHYERRQWQRFINS
jgi:acetyl esterase/lipase